MLPVPLWRFAPFRARAAFDVNLCTDSVLPESVEPGPVTPRLGFVATSLRNSENSILECWMGPFPALAPLRNSSFLTGDCLTCRLCPPIEGFISCKRLGNPRRKPRRITAEDPFPPPVSGGSPGILQKDYVPRASLVIKALRGRSERLPWFRSPRAYFASS